MHTRKIKLAPDVNLKLEASLFSGADIANLCNEAALLAARHNKESSPTARLRGSHRTRDYGAEKKRE